MAGAFLRWCCPPKQDDRRTTRAGAAEDPGPPRTSQFVAQDLQAPIVHLRLGHRMAGRPGNAQVQLPAGRSPVLARVWLDAGFGVWFLVEQ